MATMTSMNRRVQLLKFTVDPNAWIIWNVSIRYFLS